MITTFKKAAFAGVIALTMSVSAYATNTTVTDLGLVTGTTTKGTDTTSGSFDDLFTFTVAANNGAAVGTQAISFTASGVSLTGVTLYSGSFTSVADLTNQISMSTVTSVDNLGFGVKSTTIAGQSLSLTPGNTYTLSVTGSSIGDSRYTAIVAISPVPEPETYGMMLAGLGVMGFVARRRQKKNNKA